MANKKTKLLTAVYSIEPKIKKSARQVRKIYHVTTALANQNEIKYHCESGNDLHASIDGQTKIDNNKKDYENEADCCQLAPKLPNQICKPEPKKKWRNFEYKKPDDFTGTFSIRLKSTLVKIVLQKSENNSIRLNASATPINKTKEKEYSGSSNHYNRPDRPVKSIPLSIRVFESGALEIKPAEENPDIAHKLEANEVFAKKHTFASNQVVKPNAYDTLNKLPVINEMQKNNLMSSSFAKSITKYRY